MKTHGSVPIQLLADEIGWSRRHFSERFRDAMGVPPKMAAHVFRFERACRLIADKRPSLAQVAMGCHFCKTTRWEAEIMNLMTLNPCINLSFDGQCEAAFKFYERCLNAKITFMLTWGDSPMARDVPAEWSGKVAHATLAVGNTRLQGSDPAPGSYESPKGFGITLSPSKGDAERLFTELAQGGIVRMPLQETFWAQRFGVLTDRFGIPWVINCEKSE